MDEIADLFAARQAEYTKGALGRRRAAMLSTFFSGEESGGQSGSQGAPADLTPPEVQQSILTEAGDFITTEAGDRITTL